MPIEVISNNASRQRRIFAEILMNHGHPKVDLFEQNEVEPSNEDVKWMARALELAQDAAKLGEIPVGALIIDQFGVVAEAFNRKEMNHSPIAHAEVLAIELASQKLKRWRLSGCTLYVTLEPCLMCSGAIIQSRLDRVVYATPDLKAGAVDSIYNTLSDKRLNHSPRVQSGVLEFAARDLLSGFFRELRLKKKTVDIREQNVQIEL